MTARTHDLAAFTTLILAGVWWQIPAMSLATLVTMIFANMLGGLGPDLDEGTAEFWQKFRGGEFFGRLLAPLLGGHRLISHSLIGLWLVGKAMTWFLAHLGTVLLVDMQLVWIAFMLGYVSHLVADAVTKEGVPLLFPLPWKFGFPPFKALRITTGKMFEKGVVFPGLVLLNAYLIYQNYEKFLGVFRNLK